MWLRLFVNTSAITSLTFVLVAAGWSAGLPAAGISRDLARDRAFQISNIRYQLRIELKKKAATLPGHLRIEFALAAASPVVLDYRDGQARNLVVNDAPETLRQRNGHIMVPGGHLRAGENRIELDFESGIAEANRAITRYNDSQDGSEYVYTLFVPMDANQAFPCFDQPDLKARFTLDATAPADWTVISNTAGVNGHFETTKPISTYLFAFAAGPFEQLSGPENATPLRLFARRSVVARAREEWPRVAATTLEGMTRMTAFFAQPFPFPKYDQVLIPGFPYGGMEHAGATFLNEDTVLFRSVPTVSDYNRRAITVLHELAHQWFGDLVTMRWFDDLWLKEGFAQYIAYHTQAEMEPAGVVWKRFYETIKPAAYQIDGTHGTTPIYQQIANLKDAKSAYGAIVYQKAPSLLRLLNFNLGEDHFREGIRIYLREHAYSNAEWSDLIGAFSRASGTNLSPWADAWVKQRGMPQIDASWTCANGVVSSFRLSQRDVLGENRRWPLQTQILLAYANGEALHVMAEDAAGKACPRYVFANDDDHAYGRFLLDSRSQAAVLEDLADVADPFLRSLLWGALWDGMREGRLAPSAYADLALRLLPDEKDAELAVSILSRLRVVFTSYLTDTQRAAMAERLESLLIRELRDAPSADLRIGYFRSLVGVASTPRARDVLKDLFAGRMEIPGVPLRSRDRWNIVAALTALGDTSVAGPADDADARKFAFVAGAGMGTAENKKKYFAEYLDGAGLQEDWITASLPQFNRWSQSSLTLPYLKPALDALPQMKRERKIFFVVNWLESFVGSQHSAAALSIVDSFLAAGQADSDLRLKILEVRDELARTVRLRR